MLGGLDVSGVLGGLDVSGVLGEFEGDDPPSAHEADATTYGGWELHEIEGNSMRERGTP